MRWEKVEIQTKQEHGGDEASGPGKRWGHTCNSIKGGRFLYLFGGYGKDNCQTNQVHIFDTAQKIWSQPMIRGTPPIPRDSHTCTTVGDNLYVFGGTDGINPLKDLHILDTSSHTWTSPSLRGAGPEAREGHGAALVGKRLFIFGGCGKPSNSNGEVYYNDLYMLNTETLVWKRVATSGNLPSPRDSHTCTSWKNKIIVISGEDGHDNYLSDVHILDADTMVWTTLDTSGRILPPRAGHSTVAFGKNLFVFGGFSDAQNLYSDIHMLNVDTGVWTEVAASGDRPSARFSVAGDCLDPLQAGVLVFIGGCDKSLEALDDMFYLYTGLVRENELSLEKLSLKKQLKLKCQEQNMTSLYSEALIKIGINPNMCRPVAVPNYGHPSKQYLRLNQPNSLQGKKTFQARISENFPYGYTIETFIDGKPLRGILFSNKPNHFTSDDHNSSRKRTFAEAGGEFSHGNDKIKSKASRIAKDTTDLRQLKGVDGEELKLCLYTEAATASLVKSPAPSDALQLHKVISETEAADAYVLKNSAPFDAFKTCNVLSNIESAASAVLNNPRPSDFSQPHKVNADQEMFVVPSLNLEDGASLATKTNAEVSEESVTATANDTISVS